MPVLDLTFDEVLSTTRAVRKRLDLSRPIEPEVIRECLTLAMQAPMPPGTHCHFVVVSDPAQRSALADLYRKGVQAIDTEKTMQQALAAIGDKREAARLRRAAESSQYLIEHLHEVPVLVIPCIEGRAEDVPAIWRAGLWGAILPATWSFMLAARSRGLGTVLTGFHLMYEKEAAALLGIPYEQIMQAALVPVAYTLGTDFKPAARPPLDAVLHWDRW